jgi:hypothetical protein
MRAALSREQAGPECAGCSCQSYTVVCDEKRAKSMVSVVVVVVVVVVLHSVLSDCLLCYISIYLPLVSFVDGSSNPKNFLVEIVEIINSMLSVFYSTQQDHVKVVVPFVRLNPSTSRIASRTDMSYDDVIKGRKAGDFFFPFFFCVCSCL